MSGESSQTHEKPQKQRQAHVHGVPEGLTAPEGISQESLGNAQALQFLGQHATGAGALQRRAVQQLAPLLGNHQTLQRVFPDEAIAEQEVGVPIGEEAIPAEMNDFLARGMLPSEKGEDLVPASGGGLGGFNAKFDPNSRALIVTVNVGVTFINGMQFDASTGTVAADGAGLDLSDATEVRRHNQLKAHANNINGNTSLSAADKQTLVDTQWRWAGEENTWMSGYRSSVEQAWSGQHFFVNKEWSQLKSNVRVVVNVHAGTGKLDHCNAKIVKTPPNPLDIGAVVQRGSATDPNDQELIMSSSSVGPRSDNLLKQKLFFANNSASLDTASSGPGGTGTPGRTFLTQYITTYKSAAGNDGQPIEIVGRASSTGQAAYNQTLSEQRAAAVENFLVSGGISATNAQRTTDSGSGADGASSEAEWRRVDLTVGDGQAQNVAAHEFGHMLGLDDEYATSAPGTGLISGTGNAVGTAVDHNDLNNNAGQDLGIDGAVSENNDNIMSLGNTVAPQHYSVFHFALEKVTTKGWEYGGPGDAPSVIPGTPVPGGVIT